MKNTDKVKIGFAALLITIAALVQAQNTVERNLGSFKAVSTSGSYDIILKKGDVEKIVIKAKNKEEIEKLKTEVSGNELRIFQNGNFWNWGSGDNYSIIVYYKNLESIECSGSADVVGDDLLSGDDVKVSLSGSGDIKLKKIVAKTLKVSVAGSGDIKIAGKTELQKLSIAGSGDISAFELRSEKCEASIAGSGDIRLYASGNLSVSIAGSGDIYYKGNAKIDNFSVAGSGEIHRED
ncbi:MAG: head GIN domain-containing protein [Cytophagales bacterium]